MPEELSSEMPGVEEFQDVPMEDLGKELPIQGRPGQEPALKADKGQVGAGNQGAKAGEQQNGGPKPAPTATEPSSADTIKALQTKLAAVDQTLANLTRENRAYAALKSQFDRLQNELKQRGAGTQAQPSTLSPEQQAQEAQRTEAEKFLNEFLEKALPGLLEKKYGESIGEFERQAGERKQLAFRDAVHKQCDEMDIPFAEMDPIFKKLLTEDAAAAENGDTAARARLERILGGWDHHELMIRAIAERSRDLKANGARVQQADAKAADKGGRSFKPSGAQPDKNAKKFAQTDLENMTEEERERAFEEDPDAYAKAIPRQRPR